MNNTILMRYLQANETREALSLVFTKIIIYVKINTKKVISKIFIYTLSISSVVQDKNGNYISFERIKKREEPCGH